MNTFISVLGGVVVLVGGIYVLSMEPSVAPVEIELADEALVEENVVQSAFESDFLGDYGIDNQATGTQVRVELVGDKRVMTSNALPNHETGAFPNSGNPNTIQEQSDRYEFALNPVYTGVSKEARTPGVALNGVKFEPGTAEVAYCDNGVQYRIEALQDVTDLGLDFNNAHVQPSGAYHYHGVSEMLVSAFDSNDDIVHVGFASDGHLMVYSKSGAYESSYFLDGNDRSGVNCSYTTPGGGNVVSVDENSPAGTFTSDWNYVEGSGDLDECNGGFVGDEYVYFITNEYPYVPRCLKGEFVEAAPGGAGGELPGGRPPRR